MCSSFSTDLSFMGHSNLKAIQAHTLKRESGCYLFFLSSHDVVHSRATLSCYYFILVFFVVFCLYTHRYIVDPPMVGQVSPSTIAHIRIQKTMQRSTPYPSNPCFKFNLSQFPIQTTQIKNFTQIYISRRKELCNSKAYFIFQIQKYCLL